MRIVLDDMELSLSSDILEEGKEAIYEAAKQEALSKRSVIVGIEVDGEPLYDEDAFFSLSGGMDIRFISQPIRELVAESLEEGHRYIPVLREGLAAVATLFEEKKEHDAQVKLTQAIEGINWLIGVFDKSCVLLGVRPNMLVSGDFVEDISSLNNALEQMAEAMDDGKMMSLAYLIREKLLPVIERLSLYWDELTRLLENPLQ